MLDKENFLYTHKDPTIVDVRELVNLRNFFSLVRGWNLIELLNYKYKEVKNIERIFNNYPDELKTQELVNFYSKDNFVLENGLPFGDYAFTITRLFKGTNLIFPKNKWNSEVAISEGNFIETQDFEVFLVDKLRELLEDKKYYPIQKTIINKKFESIKQYFPKFTIWIWCKALTPPSNNSLSSEEEEIEGTILNLTPYIKKVSFKNGKIGGNFSIDLTSIIGYYHEKDGWKLKEKPLVFKEANNDVNFINQGFISNGGKESVFYLEKIISENDLVFIRLETLNNEGKERLEEVGQEIIDKSSIPNKIYDMIGLVDSTPQSINFSGNTTSLSITGRDLIKLLLDDGCYFYPADFIPGGIFGNETESSYLPRFQGKYYALTQSLEKSIDYSLKFIINALTNTEIVPDSLFDFYDQKEKSQKFKLNLEDSERQVSFAKGIWQIIKLAIDDSIRDRRLVDDSIGNEMGSIFNYIQKVAQEPFVEFFTDTYKDQFYLIARKPPFDLVAVKEYLNKFIFESNLVVKSEDVFNESLNFTQGLAYSWYRIIPQGALASAGNDLIFAFIKAVHFPEYAKIWGERPLEIVSNYLSAFYPNGEDLGSRTIKSIIRQAVVDLKYIIETNAYLPFTRNGSITLAGDRRFKRGTWFLYERTNEIYYIEEVEQTRLTSETSVQSTTTLTVSRGMKREFIIPQKVQGIKNFVSYFNIINLKENLEKEIVEKTLPIDSERNWPPIENLRIANNPSPKMEAELRALEPFKDRPVNNRIGYNHQIDDGVNFNNSLRITKEEGRVLFNQDLSQKITRAISDNFGTIFVQNELDALVSFTYTAGKFPRLLEESIKNFINNPTELNAQILKQNWLISGITREGIPNPVLIKRRKIEIELFLSGRLTIEAKEKLNSQRQRNETANSTKKVKEQEISVQNIVKDFKVNKDVFNFFLKRQQFADYGF